MPAEVTDFQRLGNTLHGMAEDAHATHLATKGLSGALNNVLATVIGLKVAMEAINVMAAHSPLVAGFKQAIQTVGRTREELLSTHYAEFDNAKKRFREGEITLDQLNQIKDRTQARLPVLNTQLALNERINRMGSVRLGMLSTELGVLAKLVALNNDFNQNLIEANASFSKRLTLIYQTFGVQAATGTSFRTATEAAAALVVYSKDTEQSYARTLKTVVELHEGLGMSIRAAAELAVVTERQVRSSFEAVGNVMAQLVDDTSLAADEAGRLASNLGRALATLRPGTAGQAFPEVLKVVGRYESALKELGGQLGAFEQLIGKMTTPEGILQAGILGIKNPELLATEAGVEQVMNSFQRYADQLLGNARGWDRQMRLEVLAQQFGISAQQANLMVQAIQRANEQQVGTISLQERFSKQMQAAGEGTRRLSNALFTLLEGTLYPVIAALNFVTNKLADGINWILGHQEVAFTVMAAIGATMLAGLKGLWGVSRALIQVAIASKFAQQALQSYATQQAVISAGGGSTGIGSLLVGLGSRLLVGLRFLVWTPLGAIITILTGIGVWAFKLWQINKESADAQKLAAIRITDLRERLGAEQKTEFYLGARFDNMTVAMGALEAMMRDLGRGTGAFAGLTASEKEVKFEQLLAEAKQAAALARYTRTMFDDPRLKSPAEEDADDEREARLQEKIEENTRKAFQDGKETARRREAAEEKERLRQQLQELRNAPSLWQENYLERRGIPTF
jgi:hypothetical protein